jgi:hypothetical protein
MLLHVILHLALCGSVASLPADAPIEIRVRLSDKVDRVVLDQTIETTRGKGDAADVGFDAPWGVYRLNVSVPAAGCNAVDYVVFQADRNRTIGETLHDGPAPVVRPVLIYGTGPASFHEAKPQFVFLDAEAVACAHVVLEPLPSQVAFQHDGAAYYATVYEVPARTNPLLALRLETPDHAYQYVSIVTLATDWNGWPTTIQYDFDQKRMSLLDGKPGNTLYCLPQNVTAGS